MEITQNVSLKPYNTFGVDARTRYFTQIHSVDEAIEAYMFARNNALPVLVLGGGSNILLINDWEGLVIINRISRTRVVSENEEYVIVEAGAGENWHQFVLTCISKGWGGLENLSLIPGCVGAAPIQNIGAYGVEIKDTFESLEALNTDTLEIMHFSNEACHFGYRDSVFKHEWKNKSLILSCRFKLKKHPHTFHTEYGAIQQEIEKKGIQELSIQAISDAVIAIRRSKLPDPEVLGNSGSFFKNPVVDSSLALQLKEAYPDLVTYPAGENKMKLAAGWLIEKTGLKGHRENDAGVHQLQALVLVNYGKANGREIFQLSEKVIEQVKAKFGVELEREVNMI